MSGHKKRGHRNKKAVRIRWSLILERRAGADKFNIRTYIFCVQASVLRYGGTDGKGKRLPWYTAGFT